MKYEATIFDMDGTILDTSADLTSSLNYAFEKTGHRHDFTVEDIKNFFGNGVVVAVTRALEVFKPYYADHCQIKTGPFPGILDLMKNLRQHGVKLAVVSNKPNEAVQVLVEELFPASFDFALGKRSGIRRKPAPDMTSECVKVLGVPRDKCVYIGDSEIDIQTTRNSEMDEIAVNWGFRSVPFLQKHGATVIVDTAEKLEEAIWGE
ncbi:HAD family hydrolase [Lactobacillus equicursoris]|uniref:HAD family hydrolase n=1 Tax=Lactobacillus equicursoris TaxID=420645 RepID=UPI003992C720